MTGSLLFTAWGDPLSFRSGLSDARSRARTTSSPARSRARSRSTGAAGRSAGNGMRDHSWGVRDWQRVPYWRWFGFVVGSGQLPDAQQRRPRGRRRDGGRLPHARRRCSRRSSRARPSRSSTPSSAASGASAPARATSRVARRCSRDARSRSPRFASAAAGRLTLVNEALTEYRWEGREGDRHLRVPGPDDAGDEPMALAASEPRRDPHAGPAELLQRADPLRHDQPARQRAGVHLLHRRAADRGRASRRRSARATPSGRTSSRGFAGRGQRRRRSCSTGTSTSSPPRTRTGRHPPFEGEARGRLDLGPRRARHEGRRRDDARRRSCARREDGPPPPGDVIFCALSDEEGFGGYGAGFMVEEHPELFDGRRARDRRVRRLRARTWARAASIRSRSRRSRSARVKADACAGAGGHGAMPVRGGAMAALARGARANRPQAPAGARDAGRARHVPRDRRRHPRCRRGCALRLLLNPASDQPPARPARRRAGTSFDPLLRNTVSPTMVRASEKVNVIPSEVERRLRRPPAARLRARRPGRRAASRSSATDVELEVALHDPGPPTADMGVVRAARRRAARARPRAACRSRS